MTFSSCMPGFPGGIKSRCSSFTLGDVNGDRPLDVLIGNVGDPPGNYDGAASELLLQQSDGTFVAAAGFPDGSECSSWRARDVLQVNLGAIGALRAAELSLAVKLTRRRGRHRAEELCLVLSLGEPDEGSPVRVPEALAHPAPVPNAGLGLREQRVPLLGRALTAHALHCAARRVSRRCAPSETEEQQRLSTLHGCGLHAQAHRILLAFGPVCLWNAVFCFLVFAFVLRGAALLGLALDRTGHFTSGCVKRLLLLGTSDVDRHRACPLVQKLPIFCLSVGVFMGPASVGSFSAWAHSWRSATASRRSNASWTRARLHMRYLIILAGIGSCGAQSSGLPSVPSTPGTMVISTPTREPVITTTTSDVALHGRKLSQVLVSTVAELTAAVGDSAVDKLLVAAGTYDFTSDMCSGSAVCINRALTIEAQMPGSVVLDAKSGRRVFEIQSNGAAELIGLNITGGYAGGELFSWIEPSRNVPSPHRNTDLCYLWHVLWQG